MSIWHYRKRIGRWRWRFSLALFLGTALTLLIAARWPSGTWVTDSSGGDDLTWWASIGTQLSAVVTVSTAIFTILHAGWRNAEHADDLATQLDERESELQQLAQAHKNEMSRIELESRLDHKAQMIFQRLVEVLEVDEASEKVTIKLYCINGTAEPAKLDTAARSSNHYDRDTTGVVWTIGKGCVGLAWRDAMPVSINLRDPEREKWLDPERWPIENESIAQGLTWDEIQKLEKQPYDFVAAFPVRRSRDGGEVVGILAIDGPLRVFWRFNRDAKVQQLISMHLQALRGELVGLYDLTMA